MPHIVFNTKPVGEIFDGAEINLKESAIIQTGHETDRRIIITQHFNTDGMRLISADKNFFAAFVLMNAEHGKNIAVIAVYYSFHFCF